MRRGSLPRERWRQDDDGARDQEAGTQQGREIIFAPALAPRVISTHCVAWRACQPLPPTRQLPRGVSPSRGGGASTTSVAHVPRARARTRVCAPLREHQHPALPRPSEASTTLWRWALTARARRRRARRARRRGPPRPLSAPGDGAEWGVFVSDNDRKVPRGAPRSANPLHVSHAPTRASSSSSMRCFCALTTLSGTSASTCGKPPNRGRHASARHSRVVTRVGFRAQGVGRRAGQARVLGRASRSNWSACSASSSACFAAFCSASVCSYRAPELLLAGLRSLMVIRLVRLPWNLQTPPQTL